MATSYLDFEQVAIQSYWEPKLAFVLTAGDFDVAKKTKPSKVTGFELRKSQMWDYFMSQINGMDQTKGLSWVPTPLPYRIFCWIPALLVIPIWFIAGLLSAGFLWPRQVRLWLFSPKRFNRQLETERLSSDTSKIQIADIRNDLSNLKMMSLEKSGEVVRTLQEIKEILFAAMQE